MGELSNRGVAAGVAKVGQRRKRKVVVGVRERVPAMVGEGEQFRWPAPAPRFATNLALGRLAHSAGGDQPIEMAPDGGRCKPEPNAEGHRALRTQFVECASHPITGAGVVGRRPDGFSRVRDRLH